MLSRRSFVGCAAGCLVFQHLGAKQRTLQARDIPAPNVDEDIFRFVSRVAGKFDPRLYAQILGAANEFKEGDKSVGVSAADQTSRRHARQLLANTSIAELDRHSVFKDELQTYIQPKRAARRTNAAETIGALKKFLLTAAEREIKGQVFGWSSDVIGCVVKLMTNDELIRVGQKVFNPLPGTKIGAKGYLGARVQPNSPTDNIDDIQWQVFDAFSYAVGDVLLGTNPVSSEVQSVAAVERCLKEILEAFKISDLMPHCVLSHIDVQAEVEDAEAGSTALWFQSIAGTDSANATFDISIEKMRRLAGRRSDKYGLYFETGQGADFTNGHAHGFDMVLHEARKYGFARTLSQEVGMAQTKAGRKPEPWVHLNDVAGFIGPEVFRSKEQLVRCCLEDIVMGKLHGLCIGLDVCSTLHMDVSLTDLDWCLDQIMPANPAYLMALPTKIDPMLGYLTTGFQDHVRLRKKFGFKVNDAMLKFFTRLGVVDDRGKPASHFGEPAWVYLQFRRAKGDGRADRLILREARNKINEVRNRGVFIAEGHGVQPWDLKPELERRVNRIYDDAKKSIFAEVSEQFISKIPNVVPIASQSKDRNDYILHPESGERLSPAAIKSIAALRQQQAGRVGVQIVISDGLNAHAITDAGHLAPFLRTVRAELKRGGFEVSPFNVFVTTGRVRAGYRIGEQLFKNLTGQRVILHVIGERPGSGHHTFSTYITAVDAALWAQAGSVDHNITKVVSGAAATALKPVQAAKDVIRILTNSVPV